jgi:hypothetical protein
MLLGSIRTKWAGLLLKYNHAHNGVTDSLANALVTDGRASAHAVIVAPALHPC